MNLGEWLSLLSIIAVVFGYIARLYGGILDDRKSQDFRQLQIRVSAGGGVFEDYRKRMRIWLDRTDRFFEQTPNKTPLKINEWSAFALDRCLQLAIFYPVCAAFLGWIWLGEAGSLGAAIGLWPLESNVIRVTYVLALLTGLFMVWRGKGLDGIKDYGFILLGLSIIFGLEWAMDEASDALRTAHYTLSSIGICIILVARLYGGGAGLGAVSISAAFTMAIVGSGGWNVVAAVSIHGVREGLEYTYPFIIASVISVLGTIFVIWGMRPAIRRGFLLQMTLFVTVFYCLIVYILPATKLLWDGTLLYVIFSLMLAVLIVPLVNAPFDWLSSGLTRYCLRESLSSKSGWLRAAWVLLDVFLAFALMFALSGFMIFALEGYNAAVSLADISYRPAPVYEQIIAISSDPTSFSHLWLYFALFSTLLPTVCHATIWAASLVTVPFGINRFIAPLITNESLALGPVVRAKVVAMLTCQWIVAFLLIGAVLWGIFSMFTLVPVLGESYLSCAETVQQISREFFIYIIGD